MSENKYSNQNLYSEDEILRVLMGLEVIYQSKSWLGKLFWKPWHICLETIAVQLTGNALAERAEKRAAIEDVESMLREEGYNQDE